MMDGERAMKDMLEELDRERVEIVRERSRRERKKY